MQVKKLLLNFLFGNYFDTDLDVYGSYDPATTPGYGLQSIDAVGGYSRMVGAGGVAFSSTNYWMNGNSFKSPYNENNTIYYNAINEWEGNFKYTANDNQAYPYVYDSNYATEPDFSSECNSTNCYNTPGYSIAYYVEEYKDRLIGMGAPDTITGRLLTYEEADALQNIYVGVDEYENPISITNSEIDYWLGSAINAWYIWENYFFGDFNYGSDEYGVRPVIEVYTKDIK